MRQKKTAALHTDWKAEYVILSILLDTFRGTRLASNTDLPDEFHSRGLGAESQLEPTYMFVVAEFMPVLVLEDSQLMWKFQNRAPFSKYS